MTDVKKFLPPAPMISSLDGRLNWQQGPGVFKLDTPTLAVSPTTEGGSMGDIQRAINMAERRGGGTVYIRNGTYTEAEDIIVPTSVSVVGESYGGVIIAMAGPVQMKAEGSAPYSTGTIGVTNGSPNVTGSGTSWLANLTTGHKITIDGLPRTIVAVTGDTSLILRDNYYGTTSSGRSYRAAIYAELIQLENLVMIGTVIAPISIDYADTVYLTRIVVPGSAATGISCTFSARVSLSEVNVEGSASYGIIFSSTDYVNQTRVLVAGSGNSGFYFNDSSYVVSTSCPSNGNVGKGYELVNGTQHALNICQASGNVDGLYINGTTDSLITGGSFLGNSSDGIEILGNADRCIINQSYARFNGAYGVRLAAGIDNTIVTSNQLNNNTTGGLLDGGTGTVNANNKT